MKRQKKEKKNPEKKHSRIGLWVVLSIVIAAAFGIFSIAQILYYEESVLDIYANSQDAYVQLVLDQINLVEDRTDVEIVSDILGTLDSSSNRYWTFSSEETMIFVKDVTETNRYKGFTTSTYYVSQEARDFIGSLKTNKVVHKIIPMNNHQYVASGVKFEYNGNQYQICLLTNRDTVLDHNVYLNAKINLGIAVAAVLLLFIAATISLSILNEHKSRALSMEKQQNEELRIMVERLSAALERKRLFDTQLSVFHHSILPMLLKKLEEKNISPVTVAYLSYQTEEDKKRFLLNSQVLLDEHVFRFQNLKEKTLTIVTIQCNKAAVMKALHPLLGENVKLTRVVTTENMH